MTSKVLIYVTDRFDSTPFRSTQPTSERKGFFKACSLANARSLLTSGLCRRIGSNEFQDYDRAIDTSSLPRERFKRCEDARLSFRSKWQRNAQKRCVPLAWNASYHRIPLRSLCCPLFLSLNAPPTSCCTRHQQKTTD